MKDYWKALLFSVGVVCTGLAVKLFLDDDFPVDEEYLFGFAFSMIVGLPLVILPIKKFVSKRWPEVK